MCPSTTSGNATVFLGMVSSAGTIAYVTPTVTVTPGLLESLDDGSGPLERRFRFSGDCVETGCGFWTGEQCGLGARIAETYVAATLDAPGPLTDSTLPKCAIRPRCRWYLEQGPTICQACRFVVTEARAG